MKVFDLSVLQSEEKQIFSTPEGIKKSKIELNCFLHEPEDNKIIIKQKEIISLLYKENCLDKETYEIIHKKIEQDEHALIAAFEVYAVTQKRMFYNSKGSGNADKIDKKA